MTTIAEFELPQAAVARERRAGLPPHYAKILHEMFRPGYCPAQAIAAAEQSKSYRVIRPGEAAWLPTSDWNPKSVCSLNGMFVRFVLIDALCPGAGALTRLIDAVRAAGLIPCVVEPTRELAATLTRRGWKSKQNGSDFETYETVWTP